tara:strand:- start:1 stop:237 length:237 start_codon:yes stop_codon:yes gene_type:complete
MTKEIQCNKELNKGWVGAVANHLFINGKTVKNVFVHAKMIHKFEDEDEDDYYYEIMIPTENFKISYVTKEKIRIFDEV